MLILCFTKRPGFSVIPGSIAEDPLLAKPGDGCRAVGFGQEFLTDLHLCQLLFLLFNYKWFLL